MRVGPGLHAIAACAALALPHPAAAATDAGCKLGSFLDLPVTMRGLRPIVSAQIGGKDAQFILDSGAFFSCMSRASAAQYGLRLEALPANLRIKGIGGSIDAAMGRVKEFAIGGIFAAALADYDSALAANPKLAWSLYARGLVKAKLGDTAGAKADRDAALAIDPRSPGRARKLGLESQSATNL